MGNFSNRVCVDCLVEGRVFFEGEGYSKGIGVLLGGFIE